MRQKQKFKFIKKASFLLALVLALSFCPGKKAQAALWPAIDPLIKQNLEEIYDQVKGIMLSLLKQQAVKMLNDQINKIVGGKSAKSAMFITDWRGYLVREPDQDTKKYMNDYLSKTTSGRGSKSNYRSNEGFSLNSLFGGGGSKGGGSSYQSMLVQMAKKNTIDESIPKVTYPGDPRQMLSQGNFKLLSLYLNGINNPWMFEVNAQREYQDKKQENRHIQDVKASANLGGKGTEKTDKKGDKITTNPGSLAILNVANTQDLGRKIIASASHPQEIITAIVSQLIAKAMQQGLGNISQMINKELNSPQSGKSQSQKQDSQTNGPGTFLNNFNFGNWKSFSVKQ